MAHFYGALQGNRGRTSRLGSQTSGLQTIAASWEGAVRVELEERDGQDHALVMLIPWQGVGVHKILYDGPVGGKGKK